MTIQNISLKHHCLKNLSYGSKMNKVLEKFQRVKNYMKLWIRNLDRLIKRDGVGLKLSGMKNKKKTRLMLYKFIKFINFIQYIQYIQYISPLDIYTFIWNKKPKMEAITKGKCVKFVLGDKKWSACAIKGEISDHSEKISISSEIIQKILKW